MKRGGGYESLAKSAAAQTNPHNGTKRIWSSIAQIEGRPGHTGPCGYLVIRSEPLPSGGEGDLLLHGWNQQTDQDRDDGDHNQQVKRHKTVLNSLCEILCHVILRCKC